jgi:phage terminase large subunit-like protein
MCALAVETAALSVSHMRDLLAYEGPERLRLLGGLTQKQCAILAHDWRFWARDDQLPPPGDWVTWLILAGRGAGKTRTGAETVRRWIKTYQSVNLIGATAADVRDVMVLGESGILACCPSAERPSYQRSGRRLTWPNGASSLLFSAEEPDRLRGEQAFSQACKASRIASRTYSHRQAAAPPIQFSRNLKADCPLISVKSIAPPPLLATLVLSRASLLTARI